MTEPWEPVPVQSEEGQRRILVNHERRMKALDAYPTIRTHVHNDKWAKKHLEAMLSSSGMTNMLGGPELYMMPDFVAARMRPADYLERAETGLAFLVNHARGQSLTDLIGKLQDGGSPTAVFEVMLAYALVEQFGETAVEAYPRVPRESRKNVDLGVTRGGSTILMEAVSLFDRKEVSDEWNRCLAEGRLSYWYWVNTDCEIRRFIRQYTDKASQREVRHPLVVCLNQLSMALDPDDGRRALEHVLESMDEPDKSMLVAVAYFTHGHFQGFHVFESQVKKLNVDPALLDGIRQAMERLPRQTGNAHGQ
jgi:hypothetical protein